jgi:hypothetical protein
MGEGGACDDQQCQDENPVFRIVDFSNAACSQLFVISTGYPVYG